MGRRVSVALIFRHCRHSGAVCTNPRTSGWNITLYEGWRRALWAAARAISCRFIVWRNPAATSGSDCALTTAPTWNPCASAGWTRREYIYGFWYPCWLRFCIHSNRL